MRLIWRVFPAVTMPRGAALDDMAPLMGWPAAPHCTTSYSSVVFCSAKILRFKQQLSLLHWISTWFLHYGIIDEKSNWWYLAPDILKELKTANQSKANQSKSQKGHQKCVHTYNFRLRVRCQFSFLLVFFKKLLRFLSFYHGFRSFDDMRRCWRSWCRLVNYLKWLL